MSWEKGRTTRPALNASGKGEMEELNDAGISEKGKTNKGEAGSQFQQEKNRTQLGRIERSQEMITGPKTKDKKAGALSPQELTTLQESTEQEKTG